MSDQFWISFWVNLPMIITAMGSLVTAIVAISARMKLSVVHNQINGMKDELVKSTAKASLAEGKAAGVKEEQARINGI